MVSCNTGLFNCMSCSDPNGIRTRAAAVKGRCPRPLNDGAGGLAWGMTAESQAYVTFRELAKRAKRMPRHRPGASATRPRQCPETATPAHIVKAANARARVRSGGSSRPRGRGTMDRTTVSTPPSRARTSRRRPGARGRFARRLVAGFAVVAIALTGQVVVATPQPRLRGRLPHVAGGAGGQGRHRSRRCRGQADHRPHRPARGERRSDPPRGRASHRRALRRAAEVRRRRAAGGDDPGRGRCIRRRGRRGRTQRRAGGRAALPFRRQRSRRQPVPRSRQLGHHRRAALEARQHEQDGRAHERHLRGRTGEGQLRPVAQRPGRRRARASARSCGSPPKRRSPPRRRRRPRPRRRSPNPRRRRSNSTSSSSS